MGAVVAIKTTQGGGADAQRRAGMRDLGLKIIEKTSAGSGLSYVQGLHDALNDLVRDTANYQILYEYDDDAGNPAQNQITWVNNVAGNNIFCELGMRDGSGNGADGKLKLQVAVDDRSGNGPRRTFSMNIVFPKVIDLNNYAYLDEVAGDVRAVGTIDDAKKYLAAFKLLTRCK